jgi:hypothetical protein
MTRLAINIVPMKTQEGTVYRSAFIHVGRFPADHDISPPERETYRKLIEAGEKGVEFTEIVAFNGTKYSLNYHFDNGKPMKHFKIVATKKNLHYSPKPMNLEPGAWDIIHIPSVPSGLDVSMDELVENRLRIGKILGIKRSGNSCSVTFRWWYDNPTAANVRKEIDAKGRYECNGYYDGVAFRKMAPFIIKKDEIGFRNTLPSVEDLVQEINDLKMRLEKLELLLNV